MYEVETDRPADAGRGSERAPAALAAVRSAPVPPWPHSNDESVTPFFYWRSLWRRRLWLLAAIAAGGALGVAGAWMRPPTYRAHTVLRPISEPQLISQVSLASGLLGMSAKNETDAYRYISMVTSHQFLFRLIDEHHLAESSELFGGGWLRKPGRGRWGAYRAIKRAMEVQFDRRQGNIVIDLALGDRRLAENLLGWTIGDLREQLRKSVLDECEASNRSLEEQARRTPDDIVRQEIYQQIAYDLQRAALAKVQADFAFAVIDPPLADDQPANLAPHAVGALAALATLLLAVVTVWSYDYLKLKGAETHQTRR
jgi:hypothetical protein